MRWPSCSQTWQGKSFSHKALTSKFKPTEDDSNIESEDDSNIEVDEGLEIQNKNQNCELITIAMKV
jgi:hypothetical protein